MILHPFRHGCESLPTSGALASVNIPMALVRLAALVLVMAQSLSATGPEEIIWKVARKQQFSESQLASYTFDQVETRTEYGPKGTPSRVERRLYYYFSSDQPGDIVRELIEIDGHPATGEEKEKARREDEKRKRSRSDARAVSEASKPEKTSGSEEDPFIGPRRLSDLLARYVFVLSGEEIVDGRPNHIIEFSPRPGLKAQTTGDKALNALTGRALIDVEEYQIRRIEARLLSPVKIAGGLAFNLKEATVVYEGQPLGNGAWFPCIVELRFTGKTALFFRLDRGARFEFTNFRSFGVGVATQVSGVTP